LCKKVGIPRGLFYYKYFPLWKTFMEELGAEIVVSDTTNKRILDDGVMSCIDEACLPVKLFHGHVINLADRVDYLFIPRFTSISRNEYVCPKFGGLPDMVRHTLKNLPEIIDTEVNLRKSGRNSWKAALETGSYFTDNKALIKQAYNKALTDYRRFRNEVKKGIIPFCLKKSEDCKQESVLKIAVIGHPYNLYDKYINMDMLGKLQKSGVSIITIDMIDEALINSMVGDLRKPMFWNFGRKALGSALHIMEQKDIDGIIYVMSFGCGIDSFVCDLIERKIKRDTNLPFIILTIDEHSGEAGMNTRLEAFTDMIKWRRANENNVSASG
jgi:predicted nucleotide-binding protein (sugar kinase/HSP70/actin superfamily)